VQIYESGENSCVPELHDARAGGNGERRERPNGDDAIFGDNHRAIGDWWGASAVDHPCRAQHYCSRAPRLLCRQRGGDYGEGEKQAERGHTNYELRITIYDLRYEI
jgi:hypothetical protein